jgi:ubiquinone/menaquinone biosynthesis C-methylase UbiE
MSDNDRISAYYLGRLNRNQETHEALGWESAEAQAARFSVLLKVTPKERYSLLDVGAGLGDLFRFLKENREPVVYTGADILPQMVERARRRFPEARFECIDLLSDESWSERFDVVYASGIFNLRMPDNFGFVTRAAKRFGEITERLCVANFLSESSTDKEDPYYYYSPKTIGSIFSDFFPRVEIVDGYLENDFTVVAS